MTAILPSLKIRGKHKLDRIIRDTSAGYTKHIHVPLNKGTGELQRESGVNVSYKKFMGKKQGYYRYYYYRTYTQIKPGIRPTDIVAYNHPVMMQRKHKWEK